MGYANTYPLSQLEFGSPTEPYFDLTAIAGDKLFSNATITLPAWLTVDRISRAFIDFNASMVVNQDAVNDNYVDGSQWLQMSVNLGAWLNCNKIFNQSFYLDNNVHFNGYIKCTGNYDMKAYLVNDCTLTFQWAAGKANSNSLRFTNPWITLRVVAQ